MRNKLTDMVCYRLDSNLKSQLLELLDKENISLSGFHRHVVQTFLSTKRND